MTDSQRTMDDVFSLAQLISRPFIDKVIKKIFSVWMAIVEIREKI